MKKIIAVVLCTVLCFTLLPQVRAQDLTLEETEAEIYCIDEWAVDSGLTIPEEYPTSYQIRAESERPITYSVEESKDGARVNVSETGLVTPYIETWYNKDGISSTHREEGVEYDSISHRVEYGKAVIAVSDGVFRKRITIEVKSYAYVYANKVVDRYIAEKITPDMPLEEKLDAICAFPAQYNYDASCSGVVGMIVTGGGDCWASTDAILALCDKCGIEAYARNGNRDPGAGNGHMNVLAIAGEGDYYELEAGYAEEAPRYYSVKHRTSLYCYRSYDETGYEVYQYDGLLEGKKVLEVPETVDGHPIVAIGDSFANTQETLEEIRLPKTIKRIGNRAFFGCCALKKLYIPASVEKIGNSAFARCSSLTEFTCAKENPNFVTEKGILYDYNKETVYAGPACREALLPDSVKTVLDYAFWSNDHLKEVRLGAGTTSVGKGAFLDCPALDTVDLCNVRTLGEDAFSDCFQLRQVQAPRSIESIGPFALGCNYVHFPLPYFVLVGYQGTDAQRYAVETGIAFADALGHDWSVPQYLWSEDMSTCTAVRVCLQDPSQREISEGRVTFEETFPVTCTMDGTIIYNAVFDADWAETQEEKVKIPALGHQWEETGYLWYDGNTHCSACRKCSRSEFHTQYTEGTVTVKQTKAPQIGVKGEMVCTAVFDEDWAEPQTKVVSIPALEDPKAPRRPAADKKFTDISRDVWYYDAVDYAWQHRLFGGMSENTFEPETAMTRAMLVTVLWRQEGSPAGEENTFADVPENEWYTVPVAWAAHNRIVNGVGDGRFAPDDNITREQMAAILYRYAEWKQYDTKERGCLTFFPDEEWTSEYAVEPMQWAVYEGLIAGSDGYLVPYGSATRAQVATILMRFIQRFAD